MIKYRQPIFPGDRGRDVKAVKDALRRMKVRGAKYLTKGNRAGNSFIECIKEVQRFPPKLKVDGIYGSATHRRIATHFSLFDKWRYRTARIRKHRLYTNPFPHGWIPNRLDMGFDGTFSREIVAPFAGTITYATNYNASWRGGVVQLKAHVKPRGLPTDTLYFSEGLAPTVRIGQRVDKGDSIAKEAPSGWGNPYGTTWDGRGQIEWGVAEPGQVGAYVNTYAIALGLGSFRARLMVLNFARWAKSLGMKGPTQTGNAGNA